MSRLRRFTDFILRNTYQAAGIAFVFSFIPFVGGSISMLIAGFVTLRKGAFEGCLITIAATIPLGMMFFWSDASPGQGDSVLMAMNLVVLGNFCIWLFAVILRKYGNWGLLLELAILLGLAIILILHIVYPDIQAWWQAWWLQLGSYIDKTVTVSGQNNAVPSLGEMQAQIAHTISYYTTGLMLAYTFFTVLTQVGVARWWQAILYNPGGLRQELYRIRLSHVSGVLFLVAFVVTNFGNETTLDMMPVLYVIFSLAGLSLLHYAASCVNTGFFWLIVIYALLIGLSTVSIGLLPISIALLTFMALFDIWMDLRNRFQRPLA